MDGNGHHRAERWKGGGACPAHVPPETTAGGDDDGAGAAGGGDGEGAGCPDACNGGGDTFGTFTGRVVLCCIVVVLPMPLLFACVEDAAMPANVAASAAAAPNAPWLTRRTRLVAASRLRAAAGPPRSRDTRVGSCALIHHQPHQSEMRER